MPFIWRVPISSYPAINNFPYPTSITEQAINSPDYYFEGKQRKKDVGRCGFQLTLEGRGIFCDKDGKHILEPGTGFLWEISDPETSYYYPEDAKKTWRIIFTSFFNTLEMTRELVSRFGHIYHLGLDNPFAIRMREFRRHNGNLIEFSAAESLVFISDLFSELIKAGTSHGGITAAAQLARKAVRFIHEHLEEDFNVKDMSEQLSVSHEHLSRIFKEETGTNPLDYISREKIRLACELLKSTNDSCKEICARLGYDNSSHFARTFRRVMGSTPNEFRKRGAIDI